MSALRVPAFPLLGEPSEWDTLTQMAAVIHLETEGEPDPGPLAVGWVIQNRADQWGLSIATVIFGKDGRAYDDGQPWEVFSCLNDDYRVRARARLAATVNAEAAWRAAAASFWKLQPDPTNGATFYLNVDLTKKIRPKHDLPSWAADPADPTKVNATKVLAVIGRHTFLKA